MPSLFLPPARFVSLIALALLGAAGTAAAAPGSLALSVIDQTRQRPLQGVSVVVTARDGRQQRTITDDQGRAEVATLAPGFYAVEAAVPGYVPVFEPSVQVVARRKTPTLIEMRRGARGLEEVTVVAARARTADPYGSVSGSFLSRDELINAPGAGGDVLRALDGLPGLVSTGEFASFSVRGRSPDSNLIFVDGFPLEQVVHFDQSVGEEEDLAGGGRYSIFAPYSIVGAEFSPGGWSAAYGGRAGSLLQLDLATAGPTPTLRGRLDIAGAEVAYAGPSGFHDATSVFFSARRFDFGDFFERIDELDIGSPVSTDITLKSVTDLGARDTVEVLALYAPETFDRDLSNARASENFVDTSLVEVDQDLSLVGLTWRHLLGSQGELTNRLYWRERDRTSFEGEAFPELAALDAPDADVAVNERLLRLDEAESELGWRSDLRVDNRFGQLTAGLRAVRLAADTGRRLSQPWQRFSYLQTQPRPAGQDFIVLSPSEVNALFDDDATTFSAYAEQVWALGIGELRTGLRLDREGFTERYQWSPRVAYRRALGNRVNVSATAGVFFEAPPLLVRAATPENFDLRSEKTTHLSAGLAFQLSDQLRLLVEGYYQDLDDLFAREGLITDPAGNRGVGHNYGVDIVMRRSFRRRWSADLTYSYNQNQIDPRDGTAPYADDFSQTHFVSVGGRWEISRRWQLSGRWKYGSGRPTDAFIVNEDVLGAGEPLRFSREITGINTERLASYHSLNVRVDYRRSIGPVDLILFLDVINVYGGPTASRPPFNPRTGLLQAEEDGALPLIGIFLERSW